MAPNLRYGPERAYDIGPTDPVSGLPLYAYDTMPVYFGNCLIDDKGTPDDPADDETICMDRVFPFYATGERDAGNNLILETWDYAFTRCDPADPAWGGDPNACEPAWVETVSGTRIIQWRRRANLEMPVASSLGDPNHPLGIDISGAPIGNRAVADGYDDDYDLDGSADADFDGGETSDWLLFVDSVEQRSGRSCDLPASLPTRTPTPTNTPTARTDRPPARKQEVIGPNLSEWAISRRSFVIFLMLVAVIAGTFAFLKLGRAEDPVFTTRTMIVQAAWPGATLEETLEQVTERLERRLQETRFIDTVRSYTSPGVTTIFVDLKQSTPPEVVPDLWYEVRRNIGDIRGTLPQGVVGPGFNGDFGKTYGIIYGFTVDGFSKRELRTTSRNRYPCRRIVVCSRQKRIHAEVMETEDPLYLPGQSSRDPL